MPRKKQSCCCLVTKSCLTLLRSHGLQPSRLFSPWDSPSNTEVGCYFLLQRIFLTQVSNPHLLHWQADFFVAEPPGKPHKTLLPPSQIKSIRILHLTTSSQEGDIERYREVPNSKIQTGKLYRTNHLISLTNKSHRQKKKELRRHGRGTFKVKRGLQTVIWSVLNPDSNKLPTKL